MTRSRNPDPAQDRAPRGRAHPAARHPGAREPASLVDRYCDDLLLELRMRDLPGRRIGEVLAEVRSHLLDSGQDPVAVFGPPAEYAAALTPAPGRWPWLQVDDVLRATAMFLGVWWLLTGVGALAGAGPALLGPVPVVAAALAGLAVPWLVERVVEGSWAACARGGAAFLLAGGALGALAVLRPEMWVVTVPAAVPLLLGVVVLAAAWWAMPDVDLVVDPLEAPESTVSRHRRAGRLAVLPFVGTLVAGVVAVAVVAALAGRAG